ncbi:hypothetical protein P170DRAFT_396642 [Aspergillus steynii IBT 23096]|uniref:Uncharacterized protein n=1 Tax=Aspergillus steynii IBT 23096 TaxID=1392250 RepID=A0A2I2GSQ2_9EURO|nr:uncharacterized protein P170DRAFT_396642 [Aspergillus steynii IBT 23096]PLB55890.1 hypothetical protein P170DRAFT_396642 [Aspergillus steynii IBT 23096]
MAPIFARQSHNPTPAVPRPSKGAPAIPLPGTKYISLKVLLQLFAGTICIFFLAVLFWRLGRFFRRFTKDRVLGGGNITATRYAKTWYGWIPLRQHELNKARFKRCFRWFRHWTSWNSTNDDYSWVWWDPGQKETKSRRKKQGPLRFLPACFEDYECIAADTIWSPCSRIPSLTNRTGPCLPFTMSGALPTHEITRVATRESYSVSRWKHGENAPTIHEESIILETGGIIMEIDARRIIGRSTANKSRRLPDETPASIVGRRFLSLDQSSPLMRSKCPVTFFSDYEQSMRYWQSLPCLLTPELVIQKMKEYSQVSRNSADMKHAKVMPERSEFIRCSRKYQVWSARMQVKTAADLEYGIGRSPAPPGSPRSEILRSLSSQQTFCLESTRRASGTITMSISSGSSEFLRASVRKARPRERAQLMHHQNDGPDDGSWPSVRMFTSPRSSRYSTIEMAPLNEKRLQMARTQRLSDMNRRYIAPQVVVPIKRMSDWEIRLIDGVDRRLDWLSDQLSPGRRAFHFAMLANHWLNKKTWIVYDPPSRVPIEARRLQGDPRFNVPYPMPDWGPRPKYPPVHRNTVYKPRINSWRMAMNRHRQHMGLTDFIKVVELYDSSNDEPPDGSVDPACWILRRPPQGFGVSKKQENTYYEGGTGWQETFRDWQRVRRGYRIHKAIHEGRANRGRVKEIGHGIARCSRKIQSGVFSQPFNSNPGGT